MATVESEEGTKCPICGDKFPAGSGNGLAVHKSKAHSGSEAPWKDESTLRELYIDKGLSCRKIAEELGCGDSTVSSWLHKHDISSRDRSERSPARMDGKPWTDKDTLEYLYVEKKQSSTEIANRFGCDPQTVLNWLDKYNITRRNWYDRAPEELSDPDWLIRKYIDEHLSTSDIATLLDCSHTAVLKGLYDFDIGVRDRAASGPKNKQYNRQTINCDICGDTFERVESQIQENNFCSMSCLAEWNSEQFSGENSPRWAGGYEGYYGPNWRQQRRRAVIRDQARCQDCGMLESEHLRQKGEKLHVHHITPARCFEDPDKRNRLQNLITLCEKCHLEKWEPMAPLRPDIRTTAE